MSPEQEIRSRIRQRGAITFAEFMEVALYWPDGGYYSRPERVGASGDFYTSAMAHPAFGALIAIQLFQMWQLMDSPSTFTVVEMGCGNGVLCHDLLSYSTNLPGDFAQALQYVCLDRLAISGVEKDLRHLVSAAQVPTRIAATDLPLHGIRGCFLSNELLDAFPVHQVTLHDGNLQEVYVTQKKGELAWDLGEPSSPDLVARLSALGIKFAEGQIAEINLGLAGWVENVAVALDTGFVLTVDYGHPAAELYSQKRNRGTLTTFYRHTQTDAPFRRIGEQDMTAKVDFTSVMEIGQHAGLSTLGFTAQRQFLSNVGIEQFQHHLPSLNLPTRQIRANQAGILDLIEPGGLGDFKVLAQGKNVGQSSLWGFEPSAEATSLAASLPVPLLTSRHLSLAEARYPHTEMEFELQDLWSVANEAPGRDTDKAAE